MGINWNFEIDHKSTKLIYYVLGLFPLVFLTILIHEFNHISVALIFDWDVISFNLDYFSAKTTFRLPENEDLNKIAILYSSGSFFNAIWGFLIYFLLKIKPKENLIKYMHCFFLADLPFNILYRYLYKHGEWVFVSTTTPTYYYIILSIYVLMVIMIVIIELRGKNIKK